MSSGNLNRQIWFNTDDIRWPKVDRLVMKAQQQFPRLTLVPRQCRLQDLPEKSDGPWLRRLIVAVDSRRARRELQNEFPGEIFDASTTDIREVVVHHHAQLTTQACLSCIYEPDEEEFSREQHIAEHLGVSVEDVRSERISVSAAQSIAARFPALAATNLAGTAYDTLFKKLCAESQLQTPAGRTILAPFAFVSVLAGTLLALEIVDGLDQVTTLKTLTIGVSAPGTLPTVGGAPFGRDSRIARSAEMLYSEKSTKLCGVDQRPLKTLWVLDRCATAPLCNPLTGFYDLSRRITRVGSSMTKARNLSKRLSSFSSHSSNLAHSNRCIGMTREK